MRKIGMKENRCWEQINGDEGEQMLGFCMRFVLSWFISLASKCNDHISPVSEQQHWPTEDVMLNPQIPRWWKLVTKYLMFIFTIRQAFSIPSQAAAPEITFCFWNVESLVCTACIWQDQLLGSLVHQHPLGSESSTTAAAGLSPKSLHLHKIQVLLYVQVGQATAHFWMFLPTLLKVWGLLT